MKKIILVLTLVLGLTLSISAELLTADSEVNDTNNAYVKTDKKSEYNYDSHKIDYNLTAFQDSVISSKEKILPLDIVFVLDFSDSMNHSFSRDGFKRLRNDIKSIGELHNYNRYYQNLYHLDHKGFHPIEVTNKDNNYYIKSNGIILLEGNYYTELNDFYYEYSTLGGTASESITKIDMLQVSIDSFLKKLEHSASVNNIDHRVAFVSFAGDINNHNSEGTGVLETNESSKFIPYYRANDKVLSNAFINIKNDNKIKSVKSNIMYKYSYSSTHLGMDLARKIVKENKTANRKSSVILLTDGEPNGQPKSDVIQKYPNYITYKHGIEYGYESVEIDPNYAAADEAVKQAHIIKQIYNTNIFTIAINKDADPNYAIENGIIRSNASTVDRFMHLASSNYTKAHLSKVTDSYEVTDTKYYKKVGSEEELINLADYLLEEIVQTEETNLDENTVVYDSFPDVIDIERIALDDISVYTQKYQGNGAWGEPEYFNDATITIDREKRALMVSGFDFTANLINQDQAGGSRIGISFSAPIRPGFIGGNNVVTNGPDSGIYHDDIEGPISLFPIPTVDVPLRFDVESRNHDIYLSNEFELNDLLYRDNQFEYQIGNESYKLDGINNKYVDVIIDIIEGEKVIQTINIPKGTVFDYVDLEKKAPYINDENFKLSFKVQADKESKHVNTQSILSVYKPEISVKDTVSYLGEPMNFSNNITSPASVRWAHKNNRDITTRYDKPVVSYLIDGDTYHDQQQYLERDELFSYQVLLDDKDYTKHIVKKANFRHEIKTLQVSVKKNVNKKYADADQFLFNLKWEKPNHLSHFNDYDLEFVMTGEDEIVIKDLPSGHYTLSEATDWSWRYELKSENNINFELKALDDQDYTFEFKNKLYNKKYLSKEVIVENKFGVGD